MILKELKDKENLDITNPHGFMKYSIERQEEYSTLPTDELQKIIDRYEHKSFLLRLLTSKTDSINRDIARQILEKRKKSDV